MLENEFSEKLALYFYFSFLDELKAQAYTLKALKNFRKESIAKKKKEWSAADLVRVTYQQTKKSKKHLRPTSLIFSTGHIVLPEKSNWGPWFEFRKTANEKDFGAVLYYKVLKIPEEEIAAGLDLPIGTVRYRVGKGLKILGHICRPSE
jgi:hypothetical protein